jgi:hypothetical protein
MTQVGIYIEHLRTEFRSSSEMKSEKTYFFKNWNWQVAYIVTIWMPFMALLLFRITLGVA